VLTFHPESEAMNNPSPVASETPIPASPFHPGEQAVQTTAGVRDEAEQRGQKMLTPQLVDAQRAFFAQLSFVISSHIDASGQPWTGLLTGTPGFIQAELDGRVIIGRGGAGNTCPAATDSQSQTLKPGSQLGLLGIEFARRRRNRINGTVTGANNESIELQIDQGYGNCPKFITKRDWQTEQFAGEYAVTTATTITPQLARFIASADTFFIASSSGPNVLNNDTAVNPTAWGSDISHRGGEPGFIKVDGSTLSFPDYKGNNLFNTLGNLQQYPPCGLLFLDFESGDVMQVAGNARLNHDGEQYQVSIDVTEVRCWKKYREQPPC